MADNLLDDDEGSPEELDADQKVSLAKWFLLNAPPGEIQQVASDVRQVLSSPSLFEEAAAEAFPQYNVDQMIALEMPNGTGQVLVTRFAELDGSHYMDPRSAQVATVDHVKQTCRSVRPAEDEELPSAFVEDYRAAIDAELLSYVEEAYPGGCCAVYCTYGKDTDVSGGDIELTAVISNSSFSPKNYRGGRWRSIWTVKMHGANDPVGVKGQIAVNAHYFEEGNVQLSTSYDCKDSVALQDPKEFGVSIVTAIRHQESEYLNSLDEKYASLSDTTFKELRRKLPVTRTQFSWDNALKLSLSREVARHATSKLSQPTSSMTNG